MSSNSFREPLTGLIRQNKKVIGAICLPEIEPANFVEQFNRCYGSLRMCIDSPVVQPLPPRVILPVGAGLRTPFHVPKSAV